MRTKGQNGGNRSKSVEMHSNENRNTSKGDKETSNQMKLNPLIEQIN